MFKNILIFFIVIILLIFLYFSFNHNNNFFNIPENNKSFFIIPENKEGIEISNLNKKSLHLNNENKLSLNSDRNYELKYSIQLFTSDNYEEILVKSDELVKFHNLSKSDLYILIFNSSLGIEYFILYKNFENKESTLKYCYKYLKLLDNCIAVNAMKIN